MPPIVMALTLVFILAIGYTVYKQHAAGSTAGCAVDADCDSGQTCDGGQCTDSSSCKGPTDCGGSPCVAGACVPPPGGGTCTASQLANISARNDILTKCVGTADGKWLRFDNSYGFRWPITGIDNRLPNFNPHNLQIPLDQCQQECLSDPLCTSFSWSPIDNSCIGFKDATGLVDSNYLSTYVRV